MATRSRIWGVALLGAGLATLVAGPAWAGVSAPVRTDDGSLNVRAGPGTNFTVYDGLADGATVDIACQHHGSTVSGAWGPSDLWDQLSSGGWVSDAYIYTGSNGVVSGDCAYAGQPPRPNPRSADDAISWEYDHLGSSADEGWCLRFQAQAFGWSYAGFNTAQEQFQWLHDHGETNGGSPPRGALVWYWTGDGMGHVTAGVGAGRVVGTSVGRQVGVASYDYRPGYEGWSVPYFPNGG